MTLSELKNLIPQWIKTGVPNNVKSSNLRTLLTWFGIRVDVQEVGRLKIVKVSGNVSEQLEPGDKVSGIVENTHIVNAIYLGGNINLLSSYAIVNDPGYSSSNPTENTYDNIADLLANQGDQTSGFNQKVTDATDDPNAKDGESAIYFYQGSGNGELSDYIRLSDSDGSLSSLNAKIDDHENRIAALENASAQPPVDNANNPYEDVSELLLDQNNQDQGFEYLVNDASGFTSLSSGKAIVLMTKQPGVDATGTENDYIITWSEETSGSTYTPADYTDMDELYANQGTQETGLVYRVGNASAHSEITHSGWAEFKKLATSNAEEQDYDLWDQEDFDSGFTSITENQYGTHPAFTNQNDLNAYLLRNFSPSNPTTTGLPFGVTYNENNDADTYLGSASVVVTNSGRVIASSDYFGSATNNNTTDIFISDDFGATWSFAQKLTGMFWGKMFEYNDNFYILGTSEQYGAVAISKSTDNGGTWTNPVNVLAKEQGGYHAAPNPFKIKDGFLIGSYSIASDAAVEFFRDFQGVLIFGDLTDLTDPTNWSRSNIVPFDFAQTPSYISTENLSATKPLENQVYDGFIEGNVVEKPNGDLIALYRANTSPNSNYAVYLDITYDNVNPENSTLGSTFNYIEMPGGNVKFNILDDRANSGKYWSVTNFNRFKHIDNNRIEAHLVSSSDLLIWDIHDKVLGYTATSNWENEIASKGAMYSDFAVNDNDLFVTTRLSDENAENQHDTNKSVFTKIENFRDIPVKSIADVGLLIDEDSEKITDANGIAVIHDQSRYGNSAFMLNANNANKPSFNSGIEFTGSKYLRIKNHRYLNIDNGFSVFVVVENLQSTAAERILSKSTSVDDVQLNNYLMSPATGFAIQNTRGGSWGDLTVGQNYIFAAAFDAVNGHLYNYLNGANRGQPGNIVDGTWSTNKIVLGTAYQTGNKAELWIGDRQNPSPLRFTSKIKAIHIFPTFKTEAEMISYMDSLNTKYSIY